MPTQRVHFWFGTGLTLFIVPVRVTIFGCVIFFFYVCVCGWHFDEKCAGLSSFFVVDVFPNYGGIIDFKWGEIM